MWLEWGLFWILIISYEGFIFHLKWYCKMFSHPANLKKTWVSAIFLWCHPNNFSHINRYWSDTSFLLKSFKFYFLMNLFHPVSIVFVWFCSFMFKLFLHFSKRYLKPNFCPWKFWNTLIVAQFVIIYSNSFISSSTILVACKNSSSLNSRSVKFPLTGFKIESLKNICRKIYF